MTIAIATQKKWNIRLAREFQRDNAGVSVHIITGANGLTREILCGLKPEYIFFPHWSSVIPPEIYEIHKCVVFHMTDLPFGRGGSPLQNLISRGFDKTMVSAIRVCGEVDAGDVYLKRPLSLYGGAEEIYIRAAELIFKDMIPHIISSQPEPVPQSGEIVSFKRRTPEMSELSPMMTIPQLFDHIRMLDAEGYPNAFIRFGKYKLCFQRAKLIDNGIVADVTIEGDNGCDG